LSHPAYLAVALASVIYLVPMQVAEMDWWRTVADALFRI